MWKTPGVWEVIPAGAKILAKRGEVTLAGDLVSIMRHPSAAHAKIMRLKVPPFSDPVSLDSRDQWNVEYEVESFADKVRKARVGTVWHDVENSYPRVVKVSPDHVSMQHRDAEPAVRKIDDFRSEASQWREIPVTVLAEAVGS